VADFSNFGAGTVHLGAPGVDVLSTFRGQFYTRQTGTSAAAPMVSGAAALILSACALDTAALKANILGSVDAISSLSA
jgi:subtilisin family serine protease